MLRLFALIAILATFATPAQAYIDAALGSLILQSAVAGFFAFLVMWRSWITRVKNLFAGKGFTLDLDEEAADTENTTEI